MPPDIFFATPFTPNSNWHNNVQCPVNTAMCQMAGQPPMNAPMAEGIAIAYFYFSAAAVAPLTCFFRRQRLRHYCYAAIFHDDIDIRCYATHIRCHAATLIYCHYDADAIT